MNTHTRHVLSQAKTTINGTHVVFWGWLESREEGGGGGNVLETPQRAKRHAESKQTCMECFNECHQCRRRRRRKRGAADDGSV